MDRRITNTVVPGTLFKYRDWSNKFHRKLITNQEIYFARPSEFNDPFDGNIPIRWDLLTYEDCFEKNLDFLNIVHKDKDQKAVREYAKKVTDEKTLWHPEKISKESPEQLLKWDSIIGLFSLSSISDNILMWSHYSFNHSGFVIGFDTNSLMNDYDFDYIEPIIYQKEYPLITGHDDNTVQFHKKFFHKSNLWEYEREWRISKNHITKRTIKLRKETITKVIIGCNVDSKNTKEIIKSSEKYLDNKIQIFKANKDENNFGLTLSQLK